MITSNKVFNIIYTVVLFTLGWYSITIGKYGTTYICTVAGFIALINEVINRIENKLKK